jgi:Domain of Unknown Function (DUF1080)
MRIQSVTILLFFFYFSIAQNNVYDLTNLSLSDMSGFKNPSSNWQIVGGITTSFQDATLKTQAGKGFLCDNIDKKDLYKPNQNLFTTFEHSDIYLEMDFMMPKGSNSGIYLQGRYEVQLFDSWDVKNPKQIDCGSIYQRWDEATQTGYEGHAPRVNACLAPGLWQHLVIEFQAPRFDAAGKKTQNAVMKKVVLNGITIHENVILRGPTRSAAFMDEKPKGALMIQGDHGQVAFRNIKYALLNDFSVPIKDLTYEYYEGQFDDFTKIKPTDLTRKGKAEAIDFRLADNVNKMCLIFEGKVQISESADYQWIIKRYGMARLEIDGKEVVPANWKFINETDSYKTNLTVGEHTFKASYIKNFTWAPTAAALFLQKPNARAFPLHAVASLPDPTPEPFIEVGVKQTPQLLRSYFEHDGKKKTHVISVGDPQGVHYAFDLNQAGLLSVWKGGFLNTTDMWFERGEPQTSKAIGAYVNLAGRCPIALVSDKNDTLPDTLNPHKDLILKGYTLDEARYPTFKFTYEGVIFTEKFENTDLSRDNREGGKSLERIIKATNNSGKKLLYRLAEGELIADLGNGLYAIDNQKYYLKIAPSLKPFIRENKGKKEVVVEKTEKESEVKCTFIF